MFSVISDSHFDSRLLLAQFVRKHGSTGDNTVALRVVKLRHQACSDAHFLRRTVAFHNETRQMLLLCVHELIEEVLLLFTGLLLVICLQ